MKVKLDNKNIELTKILFDIKQSLDIYKLIALNAGEINKKGIGKQFFAMTQGLAIKAYVIDICKIYEEKKRNKLNSIPEIILYIQNNDIKPIGVSPITKFAKKYEKNGNQKKDYIERVGDIVKEFISENDKYFKLYKQLRDKKLVHAEDTSGLLKTLPSYDTMEGLLFFAIDFYSMVLEAFFGGAPVDHKNDKKVFGSLHRLLKEVGYDNIKVDFDY